MTTWTIKASYPGKATTETAFADTGLRIDDTVNPWIGDKLYPMASTDTLKVEYLLADLMRSEKLGRGVQLEAFDGAATTVKPAF